MGDLRFDIPSVVCIWAKMKIRCVGGMHTD